MREIKKTKTIEEIIGYETEDGRVFKTKEEAEKYEESAEYAINTQFAELMIDKPFPECWIFENFGYGSEEYKYCVIEIKNEADLKTALMFQKSRDDCSLKFSSNMIGKRILVALGDENYDMRCVPEGTYEDLVNKFAKEVEKFFVKEEKKDEP